MKPTGLTARARRVERRQPLVAGEALGAKDGALRIPCLELEDGLGDNTDSAITDLAITDLAMFRPMMLICVTDGLFGWGTDDLDLAQSMPSGAVQPNVPGVGSTERQR